MTIKKIKKILLYLNFMNLIRKKNIVLSKSLQCNDVYYVYLIVAFKNLFTGLKFLITIKKQMNLIIKNMKKSLNI